MVTKYQGPQQTQSRHGDIAELPYCTVSQDSSILVCGRLVQVLRQVANWDINRALDIARVGSFLRGANIDQKWSRICRQRFRGSLVGCRRNHRAWPTTRHPRGEQVLAADEPSLSRPVERLHLSPSAVSQNIQSLEREFGVELYMRRSRSVRLPEAGRALLPIYLTR